MSKTTRSFGGILFEGGIGVISMLRWPGVVKAGQVKNGIQAHMDMFTSLAAAAGVPDVGQQLIAQKKQYIDGVNNLPCWKGEVLPVAFVVTASAPRRGSDEVGLRIGGVDGTRAGWPRPTGRWPPA